MSEYEPDLGQLGVELDGLSQAISGVKSVSMALRDELDHLPLAADAARNAISGLNTSMSKSLRRAFDDVIFDGQRLSDALKDLAQSMVRNAYSASVGPVFDQLGGAIGSGLDGMFTKAFGFEKGGVIASGHVAAFAKGGVVNAPTLFSMRGGLGMMGEAGAEAIMPLSRGPDGRLGVVAQSRSAPIQITMNIATPDIASFERSQTQIAAKMQRALSRGYRNR